MKFKKLMAAVTTGVLAVTSLSLSGLIGSAEVQELMNDTFESGYGAWKGVGSSLSLSTEQAHNGGTSLYCYDRTANWGAPRCSLTGIVAAGQSYEISASAMYEGSGQQNMAIKMIYTDANGTDHYDQVAATQATAGQWVEIKGNYTVPSGATDMILYVEMPDANTDQTYYIDDVVIKGEKTEIQLDDKFESDFDNNSTQKWNGRGSAKVELSTKYAHSGTTSLYVSGRTQLCNGATRSLSDIMEAGGYYKVGTYVLYDGDQYSDTQKFSINLQYDLNGKENYYTIATETANKGEWKYVGSEFTVPEGATNFYTYVQTGYTSAPKEQDLMNFYMDEIVMDEKGRAIGIRCHRTPKVLPDGTELKSFRSDGNVECTEKTIAVHAKKALVLATAGYTDNVPFRRMIDPRLTKEFASAACEYSPQDGSGTLAAIRVGAGLWGLTNAYTERPISLTRGAVIGVRDTYLRWAPESPLFPLIKYSGVALRNWQNAIVVNWVGKRFFEETSSAGLTADSAKLTSYGTANSTRGLMNGTNGAFFKDLEKNPYVQGDYRNIARTKYNPINFIAAALQINEGSHAPDWSAGPQWAIFDSEAVKRERMRITENSVDPQYFFKADTIEELAEKINTNP